MHYAVSFLDTPFWKKWKEICIDLNRCVDLHRRILHKKKLFMNIHHLLFSVHAHRSISWHLSSFIGPFKVFFSESWSFFFYVMILDNQLHASYEIWLCFRVSQRLWAEGIIFFFCNLAYKLGQNKATCIKLTSPNLMQWDWPFTQEWLVLTKKTRTDVCPSLKQCIFIFLFERQNLISYDLYFQQDAGMCKVDCWKFRNQGHFDVKNGEQIIDTKIFL